MELSSFDYNYVDNDISLSLLCLDCNKPFVDPVELPCGHCFCRNCVKKLITKFERLQCQVCSKPFLVEEMKSVHSVIRSMLDQLNVKCKYELDGCKEINKRGEYIEHLTNCKFRPSICPHGCNEKVLFKDYEQHITICKFRIISCPNECGEKFPLKEINNHICLNELIECKFCNLKMIRKELENHLLISCSERIMKCKFNDVGCDFVGKPESIKLHDCRFKKVIYLVQKNRDLRSRIIEQEREIEHLYQEFIKLENLFSLQALRMLRPRKNTLSGKCRNCLKEFIDNHHTACNYHPGRLKNGKYKCCERIEGSNGCYVGFHVELKMN